MSQLYADAWKFVFEPLEKWQDFIEPKMKRLITPSARNYLAKYARVFRRMAREEARLATPCEVKPNEKRVKLSTGDTLYPNAQIIKIKKSRKLKWIHDLTAESVSLFSSQDLDLIKNSLRNPNAKFKIERY